ncbi:MAG: hypothetical protein H7195_10305 [Chryseobacterium sp.]|nr:hypothetical protein [Chryseobacterium sp.]
MGANTFSCKINGVVHIPNDEAFGSRAISASLTPNREDSNFYNLNISTNYSRKDPFEDGKTLIMLIALFFFFTLIPTFF